jgi:hypothetical protein
MKIRPLAAQLCPYGRLDRQISMTLTVAYRNIAKTRDDLTPYRFHAQRPQ